MISDPKELLPSTKWLETQWGWTSEESLVDHKKKARLCVATLLPFVDGKPDWDGFEKSVRWMLACAEHSDVEIAFVLNADTGYIFQLSLELYEEVLKRFRELFPDVKIICGATAVGAEGEVFNPEWYFPHIDRIQEHNNVEVMLMTSRQLNVLDSEPRRDAYYQILERVKVPAIVHALEPSFVPWATPFDPWLLYELAKHEKVVGGKISTLDEPHFLYWTAMCRDLGLDFLPHSGDDYGIATAIRIGEPLLIGAGVSACPLICEARRMWLADGETEVFDTRVYKVFEAFQSLEDEVFRLDSKGSAAAYKHSTASVLKLMGLIDSNEVHPDCLDVREGDEELRMREALARPLRMAERLSIPNFTIQD